MHRQTNGCIDRHTDRPSYNDTDTTLTLTGLRYYPKPTRILVILPEKVLLKESGLFYVSVSYSVVRRRLILTKNVLWKVSLHWAIAN